MRTLPLALCALALTTAVASAHATLEVPKAAAGSTYKAVVRIGHGCEGKATLKVRIKIPEGLFAVKPMPKAGWTLETVKGAYAKAYDSHGTPLTEGVTEITWTGELPDDWYDEFVFRGRLAADLAPGSRLWIPVVQECEGAAERWIQIPAEGQSPDDLESPAPGIEILEKAGGH